MSSSERQKIVKIMKGNCFHAYLATCDGDQPVVRPVSPIVEDDMTVSVATFGSSRKVRQIKQNPRICLAFVEQPGGDKAATIIGQADVVTDMDEKKRIWEIAKFDLVQYFPEGPTSSEYCLLRISTQRIEWRDSWTGGQQVYEPSAKEDG